MERLTPRKKRHQTLNRSTVSSDVVRRTSALSQVGGSDEAFAVYLGEHGEVRVSLVMAAPGWRLDLHLCLILSMLVAPGSDKCPDTGQIYGIGIAAARLFLSSTSLRQVSGCFDGLEQWHGEIDILCFTVY